ncbi:MAG: YolD-like family protein [Psychrobacillus psychrotolerans]|uniref:YolD-like family protein n=1 Tax=Psychrobacillus psychrotolerans TaxID=126156 RepID=UPI003BB1696D
MIQKNGWNQKETSKYVKDVRRNVKWKTAMMLPEHVVMLREYGTEIKREPKPDLNEWDFEAIQDNLQLAMRSKADTKVKLWRDGQFSYNRGTVEGIDIKRRTLELQDPFYLFSIKLDEIVDVTIMD